MKINTIYEKAIKKALKDDPRPRKTVLGYLEGLKKEYRQLKGAKKKAFDSERLRHPYDDSRVLYVPGDVDVKTVMVGIDIDVQEMLLADRLRGKGIPIDLVISHHPAGRAFAQLSGVMPIQPGIWETLGFEKDIAEGIMKERIGEVSRGVSAANHSRVVDAARLLGIPLMCLHTAADNCVVRYLQDMFDRESPKKVGNVIALLESIPEYRRAMKAGAGPSLVAGSEKNTAGKIFVDMTGGTSPPERLLARLSQSGIKTVVSMHLKETAYKAARSEFLNYIVAGHISSDTLGMNLLFDSIDPRGSLTFIECSGFKRFKRG